MPWLDYQSKAESLKQNNHTRLPAHFALPIFFVFFFKEQNGTHVLKFTPLFRLLKFLMVLQQHWIKWLPLKVVKVEKITKL